MAVGTVPTGAPVTQSQLALQYQQQQQAASNAHLGRETTIHADAVTLTPQARFQASLAHFGESIHALPQTQRDQVGQIQAQVQADYARAQAAGKPYDPLAQFTGNTMAWAAHGLDQNPSDQHLGAVFDYGAALIDAHRANLQAQPQ